MAETIAEAFEKVFHYPPEIIAQAPGRINLIGEHIDYSQGFVLPFAIGATTKVALSLRKDKKIQMASAQRSGEVKFFDLDHLYPAKEEGWSRYPLGVLWALGINDGVDLYIDGEVPLGAGLSSSAALECSLAFALNERCGLKKSLSELAQLTQKAENDYVGVPCGIMDQSISLMARAGFALLLDCKDLSTLFIPLDFAGSQLELLIIDTMVHHELVDGEYANRRDSCQEAAKILGVESMRDLDITVLEENKKLLNPTTYKRAYHAVTEMARVLCAVEFLKKKDFLKFGALLNQSHTSLRDFYNVSSPELDLAVFTAQSEGALGARMVGGGFGGCAIALLPAADLGRVRMAIEGAFLESGFSAPRFFHYLPSDGAKIITNLSEK